MADILLPDSTTDEARSHGVVSFRIRPVQPVLPGTLLSNNADIFFDFNPPLRTNDAVLVAESPTGIRAQAQAQVMIFPNPVADVLYLTANSTVVDITIRTADGRLVRTVRGGDRMAVIDVADLPGGVFIAEVMCADGLRSRERFVKH
jgi:hypothetical protein